MYLCGVSAEYFDYSGQQQLMSWERRIDALRVAGYNVDDTSKIDRHVFDIDAAPWLTILKPFNIVHTAKPRVTLSISPNLLSSEVRWTVVNEDGSTIQGESWIDSLEESGEYYIDGERYSARELDLDKVPLGYQKLTIEIDQQTITARLAVCPDRAYSLSNSKKIWGITCQLYTLKSSTNWGMGDFGDLPQLIQLAKEQGADMIGLNPLHALLSDRVDTPSPYSPSDRRRINPLYLDVERVIYELDDSTLLASIKDPSFVEQLNLLRALPAVDYPAVARLKYHALEAAYDAFLTQHASNDEQAIKLTRLFDDFIMLAGQPLLDFAQYESQHNMYTKVYQHDVRFYQYLQWLCQRQLQTCQDYALTQGMAVGLVGDLAVGAVAAGCEVTSNSDLYLPAVKIGAPPDPFSETGQNWNLPAPNPIEMRRQGFSHFIELLRTNMASVGALRIDHVMSLMRLWWCLPGDDKDARQGIYVHYPLSELMALLRLESQRQKCVIIGEDLGVVPYEIRNEMLSSGLLSNKIFYFEQEFDGQFKHPHSLQADALLMVTNHDVPALCDWWNQTDLTRRKELGLLSDDSYGNEVMARDSSKQALLYGLSAQNHLSKDWKVEDTYREFDFSLCQSIHRFCASSTSCMLMIQLEDLQLDMPPVNIPGTHLEYPNWCRKQSEDTQQIFISEAAQGILRAINEERIS